MRILMYKTPGREQNRVQESSAGARERTSRAYGHSRNAVARDMPGASAESSIPKSSWISAFSLLDFVRASGFWFWIWDSVDISAGKDRAPHDLLPRHRDQVRPGDGLRLAHQRRHRSGERLPQDVHL